MSAASINPSRRRIRRALGACLLSVLLGLAAGAGARAGAADALVSSVPPQPTREYLIKAAILYNFAKFTRWPDTAFADAQAPLRLCVLGADPFGDALATVEGKRVGQRTLRTVHITRTGEAKGCHLLFVSASEEPHLQQILGAVDGQPMLTVADWPGFANAGGVINLKTVQDRSRFEVNVAAAERAGLKLSAKLLRLASVVVEN